MSSRNSFSSARVFFQVKYVYDCPNPIFPRVCIIAGRVNASAKKTTSGSSRLISAISHSQKGTGFVCGLSTRKTLTPCSTQKRTTPSSASQSPRQSSQAKLTL